MSKTIKQALKTATICRALNGLVGCPVGGWGETDQAMRRIADELPIKSARNYVVRDLVEAAMVVDHADRYQWRDGV